VGTTAEWQRWSLVLSESRGFHARPSPRHHQGEESGCRKLACLRGRRKTSHAPAEFTTVWGCPWPELWASSDKYVTNTCKSPQLIHHGVWKNACSSGQLHQHGRPWSCHCRPGAVMAGSGIVTAGSRLGLELLENVCVCVFLLRTKNFIMHLFKYEVDEVL
jgi:hypothetical protein